MPVSLLRQLYAAPRGSLVPPGWCNGEETKHVNMSTVNNIDQIDRLLHCPQWLGTASVCVGINEGIHLYQLVGLILRNLAGKWIHVWPR